MSTQSRPAAGGIKGFIQRTGKLVIGTGTWIAQTGAMFTYKWGGHAAFVIATSSVLVLMPLLFEISREGEARFPLSARWVLVDFVLLILFVEKDGRTIIEKKYIKKMIGRGPPPHLFFLPSPLFLYTDVRD